MIESLLGSINRERILLFLYCRKNGYAREIARFFEVTFSPIQKQLERLEQGGIIYGKKVGKTYVYSFNPRYPFLEEVKILLKKVLSFYPEQERKNLIMIRQRPRRKGKFL